LTRSGYAGRVGALNATMDALDREAALVQFTRDDRPILITTAVAERGVDVAGLDLVVNFDVPDHFEAYVNRIGRTGRAGQKGTAVTYFVRGPDDESAAMLVSALSGSHQFVPDDLRMVAEQYKEKIKQGLVRRSNGFRRGFGCGHGFTFTKADRPKQLMLTAGPGEAAGNAEDDEDATVYSRRPGDPEIKIVSRDDADRATGGKLGASGALVLRQPTAGGAAGPAAPARLTAAEVAAELTRRRQEEESGAVGVLRQAEFPINDLNERIRRRLTSRRVLEEVGNATETSITVNGRYVDEASRRLLQPGERSLFLLVHGQREAAVAQACRRLQAMVDEEKKRHAEAARLYSK
jgi:ATP-dependent RNA helicase DDX46/PRP5